MAMPRRSSIAHRSTTLAGGGPSSPVRATIRSVPPAMGRTGVSAVPEDSAAYTPARSRGLVTGGSIDIVWGWRPSVAPAAAAAEDEQDHCGDDPEARDDLTRRHVRHGRPWQVLRPEVRLDGRC